ncbi:MAG: hypothetical protein ACK55I_28240, partial [bacterium]
VIISEDNRCMLVFTNYGYYFYTTNLVFSDTGILCKATLILNITAYPAGWHSVEQGTIFKTGEDEYRIMILQDKKIMFYNINTADNKINSQNNSNIKKSEVLKIKEK